MILESFTAGEIKALSIDSLINRMDKVRVTAEIERYGEDHFKHSEQRTPFPRVADLGGTQSWGDLEESTQRRLADAAFRFLLQLDLISASLGISNVVVYGPNFNDESWKSPSHWLRMAALSQYIIVASRIALECFFDLLHIADRGDRMPGQSKFAAFRKWIVREDNPYKYFVAHFIRAFAFDREHRQREVHGTSRFAQAILRLEAPDSTELNILNELTNVLLGVWRPFVQIFDGQRPNQISVFDGLENFSTQYFASREDTESFDEFIVDLVNNRLSKNG